MPNTILKICPECKLPHPSDMSCAKAVEVYWADLCPLILKLTVFLLLLVPLHAQEQPRPTLTALRASQITLMSTTAIDVLSSRGLYELNPVLGRRPFTVRNQGVKAFAITGGVLLFEEWAVRKWPASARVLKWVNFGVSGAHVGAALHNWRQR